MNYLRNFDEAISIIKNAVSNNSEDIIISIDGRCASGKTTLSELIRNTIDCNVIHLDDYFLRPEQRSEERYNTPGGNIDIERFYDEIVRGIQSHKDYYFSPFDCKTMSVKEKKKIEYKKVTVLEGTYSLHPCISDLSDISFFITADYETQLSRIASRNPGLIDDFREKWIPLEEKYFEYYKIENKCNYIIKT